tara:strand:- start:401 stop:727 length:327 start_codon:yes stop_codon:yes gene_type:complete
MDRVEQLKKIQDECRELFRKKNKDYGDSFTTYGTVGVLVRISDKLRRFTNISSKTINIEIDDETLVDTLKDLHNYSAMAIMLLEDNGKTQIPPPPPSKKSTPRWGDIS